MEESLWSLIPPNTLFRARSSDGTFLYGVRIHQENGRQFAAWIGDMERAFSYHNVMNVWESWVSNRQDEQIEPVAIIAKGLTGDEEGPAMKALVEKYDTEIDAKLTPAALDQLKGEFQLELAKLEGPLKRAEGTLEELIGLTVITTQLRGAIEMIDSRDLPSIREMIGLALLFKDV